MLPHLLLRPAIPRSSISSTSSIYKQLQLRSVSNTLNRSATTPGTTTTVQTKTNNDPKGASAPGETSSTPHGTISLKGAEPIPKDQLEKYISFKALASGDQLPDQFHPTKYPVILCHGLLGFDSLDIFPRIRIPTVPGIDKIGQMLKGVYGTQQPSESPSKPSSLEEWQTKKKIQKAEKHMNRVKQELEKLAEWEDEAAVKARESKGIPLIPIISYWRGIREVMEKNGVKVYSAAVAPTASIETRARYLERTILEQVVIPYAKRPHESSSANQVCVNLIGHSMGGLDARYYISNVVPEYNKLQDVSALLKRYQLHVDKDLVLPKIKVLSLTTISTPHRGSSFADHFLQSALGPASVPWLYRLLGRVLRAVGYRWGEGFGTEALGGKAGKNIQKQAEQESSIPPEAGAFLQLSTTYMSKTFNPNVPDDPTVQYFSYAASYAPRWWHLSAITSLSALSAFFYHGWRTVYRIEGPNDGLVSVKSAQWGTFLGTIRDVNHLDLINWTNSFGLWKARLLRRQAPFSAPLLYLSVVSMLAQRGF